MTSIKVEEAIGLSSTDVFEGITANAGKDDLPYRWYVPLFNNTGKQLIQWEIVGFQTEHHQLDEWDLLAYAALERDQKVFVEGKRLINWERQPARNYIKGVRLALDSGADLIARELAMDGASRYPDNEDLQKLAHILAPPRLVESNIPAKPSVKSNNDWLFANTQNYRGKWVALRSGELLHIGDTVEEVRAQIKNIEGVLITLVV